MLSKIKYSPIRNDARKMLIKKPRTFSNHVEKLGTIGGIFCGGKRTISL